MKKVLLSCAAFVLMGAPAVSVAFSLPPNDGYVTDTAGILTGEQDQSLEQKLSEYDTSTSNQIAVLITPTLSGASISDVSNEALRKWGVGQKSKNNGALILVSYVDHSIWITTGYGLEGVLPDIVVKGIIDQDVIPLFRDGKYYEGIDAAVDAMQKHIGGEYTADRYVVSDQSSAVAWIFLFVFILINWFGASLARSKSWWAGGVLGGVFGMFLAIVYAWWLSVPFLIGIGLLFDYVLSKKGPLHIRGGRGGRGGFGSGFGGGSGGFGGFGGGSSGGGGAGGKW